MASLTKQVAVVTGSSSGIGRAIAQRLARDGARVVVNYARSHELAEAVVGEIRAAGGESLAVRADVSRAEDVSRLLPAASHNARLNTSADTNPQQVFESSQNNRSQSIGVPIAAKHGEPVMVEVFILGGRNHTGLDASRLVAMNGRAARRDASGGPASGC